MVIAINDISFLHGFENQYCAKEALIQFGLVCHDLLDDKVSSVKDEKSIITSPYIEKNMELAPGYRLIDALLEIRKEDSLLFSFLVAKLSQLQESDEVQDNYIELLGKTSYHCAKYKDELFVSIVSDDVFSNTMINAMYNGADPIILKNISDREHLYTYWELLGFREYEKNPKHGNREYTRAGNMHVGIAPETDELGQALLNQVIEFKGKLLSVDQERNDRIFEFRYTMGNKYHGFLQEFLTPDDERKVRKLWKACYM